MSESKEIKASFNAKVLTATESKKVVESNSLTSSSHQFQVGEKFEAIVNLDKTSKQPILVELSGMSKVGKAFKFYGISVAYCKYTNDDCNTNKNNVIPISFIPAQKGLYDYIARTKLENVLLTGVENTYKDKTTGEDKTVVNIVPFETE